MFQKNLQKKLPNGETEADRYSSKDSGEASLKGILKKDIPRINNIQIDNAEYIDIVMQ